MIVRATLKKPWIYRCRVFPSGTTFEFSSLVDAEDSAWYNYRIPLHAHGMIKISNKIFEILTEYERYVKSERKKVIEDFLEATKDSLLRINQK